MIDKRVARGDFNYLILNFIPRLLRDLRAKQKANKILIRVKIFSLFSNKKRGLKNPVRN